MAGLSPWGILSAARAQSLRRPSCANSSGEMLATGWLRCALAEAWERRGSLSGWRSITSKKDRTCPVRPEEHGTEWAVQNHLAIVMVALVAGCPILARAVTQYKKCELFSLAATLRRLGLSKQ